MKYVTAIVFASVLIFWTLIGFGLLNHHPVLHDSDPAKPSVWGFVEAVMPDPTDNTICWYAVDIHSVMCVAPWDPKEIEHHVIAVGAPGLKFNGAVFMRHDHGNGRWHIIAEAIEPIEKYQIVGPAPPTPYPLAPIQEPMPMPGPPSSSRLVPPAPPAPEDRDEPAPPKVELGSEDDKI